MKALRFLFPMIMFLMVGTIAFAQFDDVYFNPKKDVLPGSYTSSSNSKATDSDYGYSYNSGNTGAINGGYEGNNTINSDEYDDQSYEYYEDYTSRINRFHRYNVSGFGYYDPCYTGGFGYNSWSFRPSVTFMYDPFFNYNRYYNNSFWGSPYYGWYNDPFFDYGYTYYGYGYGYGYPYYGYGYPYYGYSPYYGGYNGWYGNGWYGDSDKKKVSRVYGARYGGAVVGGSDGYRDRSKMTNGTINPNDSRSRLNNGSKPELEVRNTNTNRGRVDGSSSRPDRSNKTNNPDRGTRINTERPRSTPQRETRPTRESMPSRTYEAPTRSRSTETYSPSRSGNSSGSYNSNSNSSGTERGTSGSSSRSRG